MRLADVENGAQQDVIAEGSAALPLAIVNHIQSKAKLVRLFCAKLLTVSA